MFTQNPFSFPNKCALPPVSGQVPAPPPASDDPHTDLATKSKPTTKKPSLYKVFLLNDDFTPMEFVIDVLETFFNKSRADATRIMMHVHQRGTGLCGVYTYEVAETKVAQVLYAARQADHPLQCKMERE